MTTNTVTETYIHNIQKVELVKEYLSNDNQREIIITTSQGAVRLILFGAGTDSLENLPKSPDFRSATREREEV